jgi:O-succinylbenzoic acid--CoA ligase
MDLTTGFTTAAFARATQELGAGTRAQKAQEAQPSYTSLVPTQLARLLASGDGPKALTRYAAVLLGGAAAPAGLLTRARALGIRVVTTYGMSETAGGCVYDGHPLEVSRVRVADDGRIWLGGDTVAAGYLGQPDLTAESFSMDSAGMAWFRTDDLGHLGETGLVVDGRIDDIINTGGLKVAPHQVEAALVALDTITEAVVVGSADDEWGQVVSAAVVVAAGDPDPTLDDVRARLRGILPDHALPRRLATLPRLPLRGPGKPDRAAVGRLFDHSD